MNNTFKQNCSVLQDSGKIEESISGSSEQDILGENNIAEVIDGRLKGKFVSPNVINLSTRILSNAEISLLSKGLKFIPTPTSVNKALIKEELECLVENCLFYGTFGMKSPSLYLIHLQKSLVLTLKVKMKLLSFI